MHFISPSAEIIHESDPFRLVERVGRTCYKSEDKITEDSAYKFVKGLVKRQHFAMLEHARLTFAIQGIEISEITSGLVNIPSAYVDMGIYKYGYDINPFEPVTFVNVSLSHIYNPKWEQYSTAGKLFKLFRMIVDPDSTDDSEKDIMADMIRSYGIEQVNEELLHINNIRLFRHHTIKFICDRGVSHELVRHRCAVAQESTRYCNYSSDKFDSGDITCVFPHDYEHWAGDVKLLFKKSLEECADTYNYMISESMKPQQARAVLNNALKTEVILTMNEDQWEHFFNLRYKGTTGEPQPDTKEVTGIAYKLYCEEIHSSCL